MISFDGAKAKVNLYINHMIDDLKMIIIDHQTRALEHGWVFFYANDDYEINGLSLGGNSPIIIDHAGRLFNTGSLDYEKDIERFIKNPELCVEIDIPPFILNELSRNQDWFPTSTPGSETLLNPW